MKTVPRLLVLALLAPALAGAHKDRLLSIQPDGSLPELPVEFKDTRVVLQLSDAPRPQLLKFDVTAGGHTTAVLPCLRQLAQVSSLKDIKVAGSWYHEPDPALPPYIHIQFVSHTAPTEVGLRPGPEFLFSLVDARLLQVRHIVVEDGGRAARYLPVSEGNTCPRADPHAQARQAPVVRLLGE